PLLAMAGLATPATATTASKPESWKVPSTARTFHPGSAHPLGAGTVAGTFSRVDAPGTPGVDVKNFSVTDSGTNLVAAFSTYGPVAESDLEGVDWVFVTPGENYAIRTTYNTGTSHLEATLQSWHGVVTPVTVAFNGTSHTVTFTVPKANMGS